MLSTSSLEKVSASFLEFPVAAAAATALPASEAGDEDANLEAPRPTVSNAPADDRAARLTAAHDDIFLPPACHARSRALTHYVHATPTTSSPHTLSTPHAPPQRFDTVGLHDLAKKNPVYVIVAVAG